LLPCDSCQLYEEGRYYHEEGYGQESSFVRYELTIDVVEHHRHAREEKRTDDLEYLNKIKYVIG